MGGLDRRKHDVDVIERVLGGVRDGDTAEGRTRVYDMDVPWVSGCRDQTLELTVGIDDDEGDHKRPKG
ncbi:MAG TPA: hypothetical protein VFO21_06760 [Vicinamibacterales bacterium]|jgi:hypothetical protein|nr:hypothetical protein [Vicinamibacterales bacterium]